MSELHNIQKSLADRLNAEFEEPSSIPETNEVTDGKTVIGLAERAQEKEDAIEKAKTSEAAPRKRAFQPIGIALVMFAFAAVIIAGETIL